MPPKGWRKDAQGNYPTTSYIKEQENVTIQDLLFPKSVITNLAKEVNSDHERKMILNKDTALALQRSATVFVNHLFMFAREFAKNQDRKSCNINDIHDALDQIGFGGFKTIINTKMVAYQEALDKRKAQKSQEQSSNTVDANENATEDDVGEEMVQDEEEDNEEKADEENHDEESKRPKLD